MTYRKKITLTLIVCSIILTLLYSILIWGTLFITEDQLYEHLLERYYTKAYDQNENIEDAKDPLIYQTIYEKKSVPEHLKGLPYGFVELEDSHILVKPLEEDMLLFLTLPEVSELTEKVEPIILLLLLIFSLIIISCAAVLALLLSRQLSAPVEELVKQVRDASIDSDRVCKESGYDEINILACSFNEKVKQISMVLKREKSFTESVSHELRTPLMVLNTNLDILKLQNGPSAVIERAIERMSRALANMNSLTNIFLVLARHDKFTIEKEPFDPIQIVQDCIDAGVDQSISWNIEHKDNIAINSPSDIFRIMISNIVENANKYADKSATLIISDNHLETFNDIKVLSDNKNSSKLGLNIIERICCALGWDLHYKLDNSRFNLRIDFYP